MQLLVQGGADAGKSFDLNQPLLVIGRQIGSDITLNDGQVSRQHLRLENRGGVIFVTDLGSANGSFINGQRLSPQAAQPLRPGDTLKLGDTILTLRDNAAPPTQAAPYGNQISTYQQYNQPNQPPQPPQPSNYQQYNQPAPPAQPGNYQQYNQPAQPQNQPSNYQQYSQPAQPQNQPSNYQQYNAPQNQPGYQQYNASQNQSGYGNSYQPSQPGIYQQPGGYNAGLQAAPVRKKGNGGLIALFGVLGVALIAAVVIIVIVLTGKKDDTNSNNPNRGGDTPAVVSPGVPTPTRDPGLPTVTANPNLPTVTPNPNNPTPATSPIAPTPTVQQGGSGTNPPPPPPNGSGNAPATTAVAVQTTAVAVQTTAVAVATTPVAVATTAPTGNSGGAGATEAYNMSVTFPEGWRVSTDDGKKQISGTSPDSLSGVTMLNTDQDLPGSVEQSLQAIVDELKKSQPNSTVGQINVESGGKQASVRVQGKDTSGRSQIVDVYLLEGDDGTGFVFAFQSVAQAFPADIFRQIRSSIRFG